MAQEGDLRWWPLVKSIWPFASSAATTLFAVGASLGILACWRMGAGSFFGYFLAISDPAAASLVLLFAALITPNLYAPGRIASRHIFMLPTLYGLGIILFRMFIAVSPVGSVLTLSNIPRLDQIWSNLLFIGLLWIIQILVLAVCYSFDRRRPKAEGDKLP